MTTVYAVIGAKALYLLYGWLISAAVSAWLSDRKGYGEKPGLTTALVLTFVGVIVWLIVPAKPDSKWKQIGMFGRGTSAERRATAG